MCIRDSGDIRRGFAKSLDSLNKPVSELMTKSPKTITARKLAAEALHPVSYTHLDVYKRQLYNFLAVMLLIFFVLPYFIWRYFREKGFPRRFRQSMGFIRDVYKRQGQRDSSS